ncbi:Ig-like domain repeat protein [Kitasatospora sp. NPDC094028]
MSPLDPTVAVGGLPTGVAITPDGLHAYVANKGGNTVSLIETATNTVTTTIPVGTAPFDVAITPDGLHAYVTNNGGNTVSVIETATNTIAATIPVGTAPTCVAITPDGLHAYVTNNSDNTVSVIETATNTIAATIPVGAGPFDVAITPDGLHEYVTNNGDNTVSVTATVTSVDGTPTGTVSFFDGTTLLGTATLDPTGAATFTTSALSVGSHPLTAVYSGDASFNGSSSPVDTQTVNPADTTTVLTSAPDPSAFGQPKVLTATVTAVAPGAGTPTGTVSFFDGPTLLGTATLVGGVATFTTSALSAGTHLLTAVYNGDVSFNGSTSPVDTQTVNTADTTTVLTSAPDPSVFGQPKVLTATVAAVAPGAGTPTGTVSFFNGATRLGTAALVGGVATFTTSALSAGTHLLTAVYNGSAAFNGSTSPVDTQTVSKAGTLTALASAPDPSVFGQAKVLTAIVAAVPPGAGTPTGTVSFFNGATLLHTTTLVGGVATFTTSALSVGTHLLTAVYNGSAAFNGSTSPVDIQTVTSCSPPSLQAVVPSFGPAASGSDVLLIGSNLNDVTGVTFGGVPAVILAQSLGIFVAVAPNAHKPGTVPVVVHTSCGTSNTMYYTYR